MKKIYKISLVLLSLSNLVNSQTNLVPNPGFETASPCPDYPGQTNYATGWNNVNLVYNNPSVGTPDFFHACGSATLGYNCVPPNTFSGICSPHTGNGFMSSVLYNIPYPDYREYFATQLTTPMSAGTTYTVGFWLTNGSTPYSPFTIKNIGMNFSTSPLSQSGWGLISLTPQYEVTTQLGSTGWVHYTTTLTATSNWQYVTIGCFRTDASNNVTSTYSGTSGPNSSYARYYFDDIEVFAPSSAQGIMEINSAYSDLKVYPNPSADVLNFSSTKSVEAFKISDIIGQEVEAANFDFENKTIDIRHLKEGVYMIKFYNEGKVVSTRKFIKQN